MQQSGKWKTVFCPFEKTLEYCVFQRGIHHWQHSRAGCGTKEESKERHKLWDISADIWQRKAFVLVTVSCQKRRHQTRASPQNMLPITHTFEKLICVPHHLNLAVEGWSSAVAEIVWDKWAASCQEDTLGDESSGSFLELLSCRQQHEHASTSVWLCCCYLSQSPTVL